MNKTLIWLFFLFAGHLDAQECGPHLRDQSGGAGALVTLENRLKDKFPNSEARIKVLVELLGASQIELSHCCEGGNLEAAMGSLLEDAISQRSSTESFLDASVELLDRFEQMQNAELAQQRGTPAPIPAVIETARELSAETKAEELSTETNYTVMFEYPNDHYKGPQTFRFSEKVISYFRNPGHKLFSTKFLAAIRKGLVPKDATAGIKRLTFPNDTLEVKIRDSGMRIHLKHENGIWYAVSVEDHL